MNDKEKAVMNSNNLNSWTKYYKTLLTKKKNDFLGEMNYVNWFTFYQIFLVKVFKATTNQPTGKL